MNNRKIDRVEELKKALKHYKDIGLSEKEILRILKEAVEKGEYHQEDYDEIVKLLEEIRDPSSRIIN